MASLVWATDPKYNLVQFETTVADVRPLVSALFQPGMLVTREYLQLNGVRSEFVVDPQTSGRAGNTPAGVRQWVPQLRHDLTATFVRGTFAGQGPHHVATMPRSSNGNLGA